MLKFSGFSCLIRDLKREWGRGIAEALLPPRTRSSSGGASTAVPSVPSREVFGSTHGASNCHYHARPKRSATVLNFATSNLHRARSEEGVRQLPPSPARGGGEGFNRHSNKHAPRNIPEAPGAFEHLMTRWTLQFALRIAFRCVLHRCGSQDIHC